MNKKIRAMDLAKVMIILLVTILLSYGVTAFGVSPSIREVYFEPDLEKELYFHVINNDAKNFSVSISVGGDLKDYIALKEKIVNVYDNETKRRAYYTLNLPSKMDAGRQDGNIIVQDSSALIPGGVIGASMSLITEIDVIVVPEGKYVKTTLEAEDTELMGNLEFRINVENIGSDDIAEAKGNVKIFSPDSRMIATIDTNKAAINKHSKTQLQASLQVSGLTEFREGIYYSNATVYFNDKISEDQDTFKIGQPKLNILDIDFIKIDEETNKFEIQVQSNWNTLLENGQVILEIKGPGNNVLAVFNSYLFDIDKNEIEDLTLYTDLDEENIFGSTVYVKTVIANNIFESAYLMDEIIRKKVSIFGIMIKIILLCVMIAIAIYHIINLYKKNLLKSMRNKKNNNS